MRGVSSRAQQYIKARAEENMSYTCRIERLGVASFNDDDSIYTAGTPVVVYTGKCRIWEVAGGGVTTINDEEVVLRSTQLSIPWNNIGPKRDDEVKITAAPLDPALVGRRYRILDVAEGGDLRATRRFTIQGIQEDS